MYSPWGPFPLLGDLPVGDLVTWSGVAGEGFGPPLAACMYSPWQRGAPVTVPPTVAGAFHVAGKRLLFLVEAFGTYPSMTEYPSGFHCLGLDLIVECEQLHDAGPGAKAQVADDQAG
jgi:hypothetical protein